MEAHIYIFDHHEFILGYSEPIIQVPSQVGEFAIV